MPRSMDIVLACLALVVFAPLMALISAALWLTIGQPILFRQERVGQYGRTFIILKFRTLDNDENPTRFGKILRRYSLDELPQFWNVLTGAMALVGPRPLLAKHQPENPRLRQARQELKPGITGWAQINGRNALAFEETYRLDLLYKRKRSTLFDTYVLLATLPCLFASEGVCSLAADARPRTSKSQTGLPATV